ncbi:MAG: hypothetical protein P0Y66_22425 [Candidatus Kaistia colombiensis]|nr:MAG: hypothetical protein P0Y66_22425 [Kaistia sp.]
MSAKLVCWIYLVAALVTYGHAVSAPGCPTFPMRTPDTGCEVTRGLVSGAAWPLYWTGWLFTAGRAALEQEGT